MRSRLLTARIALIGLSVLLGLSLATAYAADPGLSDSSRSGTVSTGGSTGKMPYGELTGPFGSLAGVGKDTPGASSPGNSNGGDTGNGNGNGTGGAPTCQPSLDVSGWIEIPGLSVSTNPPVPTATATPTTSPNVDPHTSQAGVVGVPTWLWNDYDGSEINAGPFQGTQITCPGSVPHSVTLYMHAWPTQYQWNFGDVPGPGGPCGQPGTEGSCPPGALGMPNTPDVQHTYETASPDAQGYHVTLDIDFVVDMTIDGGQPDFLPPIHEHTDLFVPVRQIQSVLVPVPSTP